MKTLTLKQFLIALAVFTGLLCLAYLPKITHVGYLQDDWNVIFVAEQEGPGSLVFHYSIDRPLQGFLALIEYRLLQANLPAYLILSLLWRLLDSIVFFLLLGVVWPKKWGINLLIASLVLVYPGFHEQPHAFNYQVQYISRLCLLFSILASLLPFRVKKIWQKVLAVVVALTLAQIGYGLLDYQIGLEALRLALLFVLFIREEKTRRWWKNVLYMFLYLLGAGGFTYWRLFLFASRRESVDAGTMLAGYGNLAAKLLENGRDIAINLYRLIISAFYTPLFVFGRYLGAGDWILGVLLALLGAGMVLTLCCWLRSREGVEVSNSHERHYPLTLVLVGLAGALSALLPIIFGGRELLYGITGDRYSYPGSVSAAILLVGLIWLLRPYWLRASIIAVLVFLSVLTQFSNDVIFEKNGDQTRAVWWQMSWRAPQLKPTTMLTGHIYLGILDEDYTLWGPANLIYYPGNRDVVITAEVLDPTTVTLFEDGKKALAERKGIEFEKDFGNLLVLSKTESACLHLIDGQHPEYSQADDAILRQVGELSQLGRIDVNSDYAPAPRKDLFGSEPPHDWCYYYQMAQLARQQRNWQAVATLGDEAIGAGHAPNDPMEWLVFMQAFAYTGDEHYQATLAAVTADAYSHKEACTVFQTYTTEMGGTVMAAAHETLLKDVCATGK